MHRLQGGCAGDLRARARPAAPSAVQGRPAAEACQRDPGEGLARRNAFRCRSKDGRWLHSAACEPSALPRHCLRGRRSGDPETLRAAIAPWSAAGNRRQREVDWQVNVDDVRRERKSTYRQTNL